MNLSAMKLNEIAALPGVVDLPLTKRAKFAAALRDEANGDHEAAEAKLEAACAA